MPLVPLTRMNLDQYRHKTVPAIIGLIPLVGSFFIYLLTTSPTVYLGDSGEFIASAFGLGNPHNSGYPLYALTGKIFSMIPLGNIAFRLNLMSACFGALTVWLTYRIIFKVTGSFLCAISSALLLAFSSTLWSQTSCAEVYTLHAFFVALIITLVFWWHETMSLDRLLMFAFAVGISFGNHLQTVMLAPALCFFIMSSDRKVLLRIRNFFLLIFFLALGLSVYLYLPIRTEAGTAIHWGDPDTLGRFLHHVMASDHRHGYVFSKSWATYGTRLVSAFKEMITQYHLFLVFAAIGWAREKDIRFKVFWILIVLFDTTYTVFLNTISLEITAFQIPSAIVLGILIGKGMASMMEYRFARSSLNRMSGWCLRPAFVCFPVVLLTTNLYQNDQHNNYTAYEYGINVLRGVPGGGTLVLGGDNIVFPVGYLRLAEHIRPDVAIYDRYNLIFKMPFLYKESSVFVGQWEELREIIEAELVKTRKYVYLALFNDKAFSKKESDLIPHGLTYRAVPADQVGSALKEETDPWLYYVWKSVNSAFYRDYMNRSVTGYFLFKIGRDLVLAGKQSSGIEMLNRASSIASNDHAIHIDLALFYTDMGMYEDALPELKISSRYAANLAVLHNTWGYYYSKIGSIPEAIEAFEKSIAENPEDFSTHNNLGLMFLQAGRGNQAKEAFKKSLSLNPDQAQLIDFMKTKGI
jgi:tetratricopeptide (TPR) repeat protein